MIHSSVQRQFNICGLIIAFCNYGVDYYWKDRNGFLFTSGKTYLYWHNKDNDKSYVFDIRGGLRIDNRDVYRFPHWWSKIWLNL